MIRVFEGNREYISKAINDLKKGNVDFCVRAVEKGSVYALSVNNEDYVRSIKIVGDELDRNFLNNIVVISPDGKLRNSLAIVKMHLSKTLGDWISVLASKKSQTIQMVAEKLNDMGIVTFVGKYDWNFIFVRERDYIKAVSLGSKFCIENNLSGDVVVCSANDKTMDMNICANIEQPVSEEEKCL